MHKYGRRRTPAYLGTIFPGAIQGAYDLEAVRATIRSVNAQARRTGAQEYKVELKGRMGRDNPARASYPRHVRRVRLADAKRIDVYVHHSYPARRAYRLGRATCTNALTNPMGV